MTAGSPGWRPAVDPVLAVADEPSAARLTATVHHLAADVAAAGRGAATAAVPLRTVGVTGVNVHGLLREPARGGASVLLSAHHDGVGDDADRRLPGASASGVAVVLEAARLLASTLSDGIGLAVAFLDGEETGALGSAHHARHVTAGTFVINVDGAGRLVEAAAVEAGGLASDNRRYAAAGLPAVGIGMGMPDYHTPADTSDRVEPDDLTAATRLVTATVHHLYDTMRRRDGVTS